MEECGGDGMDVMSRWRDMTETYYNGDTWNTGWRDNFDRTELGDAVHR